MPLEGEWEGFEENLEAAEAEVQANTPQTFEQSWRDEPCTLYA
jgi:hypothetical protein